MARILYGVCGDGYGHATRAHSIGAGLLERGHDVHFVSSLHNTAYLAEHFPGRVDDIFGLKISFTQGEAVAIPTILQNFRRGWRELGPSNQLLRRLFREHAPDLVVSDFEPLTAFWARRLGVPFISVDNVHTLTHCALEHPPGYLRDRASAYLVIRLFYTGAKKYLITTFFRTPIRHHPTKLIDPVLRPAVYRRKPTNEGFLLAYKGGNGEHEPMRRVLADYERMPIRAYGFGTTGVSGRATFKAPSTEGFLDDLASCAGVVATGGHSLVCECFHFEKPMFLIPLVRQYEQRVNAAHMKRQGVGTYADRLDASGMDAFVDRLEEYRKAIAAYPKASLGPVLDAIEQEIP